MTSDFVLFPMMMASLAAESAMVVNDAAGAAHPETQAMNANATLAQDSRRIVVVHIFKFDQSVIRPALVSQRQVESAVKQDLAVAIGKVGL